MKNERNKRNQRNQINFLVFLLAFLLTISCAPSIKSQREAASPVSQKAQFEAQVKEIESAKHVKAMNEKILLSSLSHGREPYRDYKIGPEDLIEISVFEDEKLNKTVRVSSQGNISLPLLGILRVKGLTSSELEKEIRDLLAEKYFQDPHVAVFIKEYRSQQISVIGAVEKPGVYDFMGQKTILDALALSGGLKAGREGQSAGQLLFLIRPPTLEKEVSKDQKEEDEQKPRTFVIDLEDLLIRGNLNLNLGVSHGDVINVPSSGKIFVGGEVKSPGGFPLTGKKLTVGQAIIMAGGLKYQANGSETKIFRTGAGAEKETLIADVDAIQKGQKGDFDLQENDIVIVPKSGAKSVLIGIRDSIKGLIGFGFSLGTL